jgi:hypothetical protein
MQTSALRVLVPRADGERLLVSIERRTPQSPSIHPIQEHRDLRPRPTLLIRYYAVRDIRFHTTTAK